MLREMTAGNFFSFLIASGMLIKPIRALTEVNSVVQRGIAAADSIFDVLDSEQELDEGDVTRSEIEGRFVFDDVSFRYCNSDRDVLRQINFVVEPGESIALVGSSGAGKSTLVNLIPRFYNHTGGSITLDGVPIEAFTLENLRSHIALVSQRVTLFNDTIYNNIAYGELAGTPLEKVREAARFAHADEFIQQLEHGYQTLVGDNGVMLSGGQRQRIAIARALLKDAPILILDEATSALDTESERHIQAALEQLMRGRTSFVIAHRLSTIENADRILVVEEGMLVESGSHSELLATGGRYAQLHQTQFSGGDTALHYTIDLGQRTDRLDQHARGD
jgi:subfamily B ATP-binding cassette protein MsbA